MTPPPSSPRFDRRWFLAAGATAAVAAVAAACGSDPANDAATVAQGTAAPATTAPEAGSAGTGALGTAAPATSTAAPTTRPSSTTKADGKTTTAPSSPTTTAPRGPAQFVVSGPAAASTVALTFHTNGDLSQVKAVLDIVEKRNAVLTAFIVGNWLDANPSMGKRLLDGRHELANHTYTHPNFEQLSPTAMVAEISKCRDAIAKVSGSGGRFFRLSGTDDGTATPSQAALTAAATAGYAGVAGFDVDPLDYKDPGAQAVIDRTLQKVKGGSIISLHMGHAGTIDAIGPILDGLASKKLQPVTLSTLLS